MSSFPTFFHMSPLAQELLFDYCDLPELLTFSQLSKRALRAATTNGKKFALARWEINNGTRNHCLKFFKEYDYSTLAFQFIVPINDWSQVEDRGGYTEGTLEIDGVFWRTRRGDGWMAVGDTNLTSPQRLELLEKLSRPLLRMLHIPLFDVSFESPLAIDTCFVWKLVETWDNVATTSMRSRERLGVPSAWDINFLLDTTTTTHLALGAVDERLEYSKPLKAQCIKLERASFLTMDAFVNTDCKSWLIQNDSIPVAYLSALLKKWVSGGLQNLETLTVRNTDKSVADILEDVPARPWNGENRPDWNSSIIKDARDLERSDGRRASALLYYKHFRFVVWSADGQCPKL